MAEVVTGGGDEEAAAALKAFLDSKSGVKDLVDAGITKIPRIFILPPEDRVKKLNIPNVEKEKLTIPVIDISWDVVDSAHRAQAVIEIGRASEEWGFFQVVGHGIPVGVMDAVLKALRGFHEGDHDAGQRVKFLSHSAGRLKSRSADWKDSLFCLMDPQLAAQDLPPSCREPLVEYSKHAKKLGATLFELLSEALGLSPTHLESMECNEKEVLLAHYYPPCPEPELTVGTKKHTDASFLTLLLQDKTGGLQVLHRSNYWVDVLPVPGALVVNIGDLMQLISNDQFRSSEHRVVVNTTTSRVSVAYFFIGSSTRVYGPITELITDGKPLQYGETLVGSYMANLQANSYGVPVLSHYKL